MSRYGEQCWIEIPVTNVKRAIQFYQNVFDWTVDEEGYPQVVDGAERLHFFSKGNFRGSFRTVPEDRHFNVNQAYKNSLPKDYAHKDERRRKPLLGVTSTLAVEDMDATLRKIEECGGEIFEDKQVLGRGLGALARFADTEGNVFSLFSLQIGDVD